jgi:hypothetical protein
VYDRKARDPDFRRSVEACRHATFAAIMDEVFHRAVIGDWEEQPILVKGGNDPATGLPIVAKVGTVRRRVTSDRLLALLARILMPEKYGALPWEGFDPAHPTGRDIHRIALEVAAALGMPVAQVKRLAAAGAARASGGRGTAGPAETA